MKLFIDNRQVDMDGASQVSLSLAMASVADPGQAKTGYTRSITIPMTPRNMGIMGGCEEINARDRFNDRLHEARIEFSGCVVMEGAVHLTECCREKDGCGYYRFNVIGAGKLWVNHAAANTLASLFPAMDVELSGNAIAASWTSDSPVRFLPVQRDIYNAGGTSGREFGLADYHPFINLYGLMTEIFRQAGYTLDSSFLEGDFFRSLYMSGRMPLSAGGTTPETENGSDFRAGRFAPVTATANSMGRVSANPYDAVNTIGNIVDTADPTDTGGGAAVAGVYDNGGCFGMKDGRVVYTPKTEVSAGFRYEITYETGYSFVSRTELQGFNEFYLGNGETHKITIANPYEDRKNAFRAGKEFVVIIPSHLSNMSYRFGACRLTNPNANLGQLMPEDYEEVTIAEFSAGSQVVYTDVEGDYVEVFLMCTAGSVTYPYPVANWLLYDGYVAVNGRIEVSATLTTAPQIVSPSNPKRFDDIYFGGGKPGMELTVKSAYVSPVFEETVVEIPTETDFGQLVPSGVGRMDVVEAVRHMFNLCFYTDNLAKVVHVEPRGSFFDGPVVDWSDRIDHSKPMTVTELGDEVGKTITFRYTDGDGALERFDAENGGRLGSWTAQIGNLYASDKTTVMENPLFSPSVDTTGNLSACSSASLVNAGDRDSASDRKGGADFPVKVVRYLGMTALPSGESWVWPAAGSSKYPLAAFHYPAAADGLTLCFDDRDGLQGLHRWWDTNIESYNSGRRLTVWLRLGPDEIEALMQPNSLKRDFRAAFRLRIGGEYSMWRLEEVCGYNPSNPSTKCALVKV